MSSKKKDIRFRTMDEVIRHYLPESYAMIMSSRLVEEGNSDTGPIMAEHFEGSVRRFMTR